MIIPIDRLVDKQGNMYEMTYAAIKRALQLAVTGDEEIPKNDGKVCSVALKQVLNEDVEYRSEKTDEE